MMRIALGLAAIAAFAALLADSFNGPFMTWTQWIIAFFVAVISFVGATSDWR